MTTYDLAGNMGFAEASAELTVPATICAVDLRGQNTVATVSSVGNPNTLFYLDESATAPTGATNVVKGTTASAIALTDGYDFFAPEAFTATSISYDRTFTTAYSDGGGWSTITLPFAVSEVTTDDGERVIDWFHSATDEGKNFWVMNFAREEDNTVVFDYAEEMKANTPYIITVPGNQWGSKWNLQGKTITFSGSNANIAATSGVKPNASGNFYRLKGTLATIEALSNIYPLNDAGTWFELSANVQVPAFRAYFERTNSVGSYTNALNIGIGSDSTTGIKLIDDVMIDNPRFENGVWFDLQGRRIASPKARGLYILNGKKIMK